jgi:hypothetical protein
MTYQWHKLGILTGCLQCRFSFLETGTHVAAREECGLDRRLDENLAALVPATLSIT